METAGSFVRASISFGRGIWAEVCDLVSITRDVVANVPASGVGRRHRATTSLSAVLPAPSALAVEARNSVAIVKSQGTSFYSCPKLDFLGATKSMKKLGLLASILLFIVTCGIGTASATSSSATMAVTVTVAGSVSLILQTDASGLTLTNSGTSAVIAAFGTMSAYGGTVPTGVTKTVNAPTNWKISTPFDVVVQVANQTSATYTLTAQLQTADATNTWQIGATTLTASSASTLTATGAYGNTAYTFNLTIPFSEAAGAISNTINFVATAN